VGGKIRNLRPLGTIVGPVVIAAERSLLLLRLYDVTSTAKEYHEYKNVPFVWFREGKRPGPPRPYGELIKDYDVNDEYRFYAEHYIDELFTEDEARQLKDFLDSEYGEDATTTITEVQLPFDKNLAGVGSLAVGGGDDFYMLSKAPGYSLPFSVWAISISSAVNWWTVPTCTAIASGCAGLGACGCKPTRKHARTRKPIAFLRPTAERRAKIPVARGDEIASISADES
jgi:hypothetical protein